MGLKVNIKRTGSVTVTNGNLAYTSNYGQGITPAVGSTLADGSASNQAHVCYEASFTLAAGASQQIDLKGGNGEVDVTNVALALTYVKSVEMKITSPVPSASVSLQFGPQAVLGVSNTAPLWFKPSNAATYEQFTVTSANATVGSTYTNNTQTFTTLATIAASTTLYMQGTGAPTGSGTLTKASGTGDATITFSAAATPAVPFLSETVQSYMCHESPGAGWAIDSTHKVLIVQNPSAVSVTFWVRVIGY
jgi:hypothetical protein